VTSPERGEGDSVATEAKQVHTVVYLNEGFIQPEQLNADGLYEDEYTSRSDPILVKSGAKETTIRMIHTSAKEGGILSLPTARHFSLDPDAIKKVAGASRLSAIDPKTVVEISGLASMPLEGGDSRSAVLDATRQAYAMGLRLSLDQGHSLWMMNVDPKLKGFLTMILGEDMITQIGEMQDYMSPPTVPIALNPQKVVESILLSEDARFGDMNRADIKETLEGVSEKHLTSKLVKLLHQNDIQTKKESLASKVWSSKKLAFYAGIVGYSALRFLPVGAVSQFHGSVPLYATIDVGTAFTQIGSMELFLQGRNRTIRALGALGTGASFAAPYAYFWANGDDYPWYVNAVASGFVAIGVGIETKKTISDNKIRKGLEHTDIPTV